MLKNIMVSVAFYIISLIFAYQVYFKKTSNEEEIKKYQKYYRNIFIILISIIICGLGINTIIYFLDFDEVKVFQSILSTGRVQLIFIIINTVIWIFFYYLLKIILKYIFIKQIFKQYFSMQTLEVYLPKSKLNNCIYNFQKDEKLSFEQMIERFQKLYINKKIYLNKTSVDQKDFYLSNTSYTINLLYKIKDFCENIPDRCCLVGDAGCGKSTLIFNIFITIIQNKHKKYIPIFIDLKDVKEVMNLEDVPTFIDLNNVSNLSKLILYKLGKWIEKLPSYNFLNNHYKYFNKESFKQIISIPKEYKFLILLDSYDECSDRNIAYQIKCLEDELDKYLDQNFKIILAMRENALNNFYKTSVSIDYKDVFTVRDYEKPEVQLYLNKLVEQRIIDSNFLQKIKDDIDLLTFDEDVNPFIVSLIVSGYIEKMYIQQMIIKFLIY